MLCLSLSYLSITLFNCVKHIDHSAINTFIAKLSTTLAQFLHNDLTKTITYCRFEKIVLSTATFHTIFVMSPLLGVNYIQTILFT
jgi:hypothetical protein